MSKWKLSRKTCSYVTGLNPLIPSIHITNSPYWSPYIIFCYYSFKIFPLYWLVKTTRIIHHNHLLLTKFGKNFVILNWWCQKCSLLHGHPMIASYCFLSNILSKNKHCLWISLAWERLKISWWVDWSFIPDLWCFSFTTLTAELPPTAWRNRIPSTVSLVTLSVLTVTGNFVSYLV